MCKISPCFAQDFMRYPSDLCREVRESQGKVCWKSQGIQIELTGGNPVSAMSVIQWQCDCQL